MSIADCGLPPPPPPAGGLTLPLHLSTAHQSPAAEPPAGIAAPRGGDADSAGQLGERVGAAGCGSPLNPVAAEAAEMLVHAARPTASSTFSGYRYAPEGAVGWLSREEGAWLAGRAGEGSGRGRGSGRGSPGARLGRSTRGRCGSALGGAHPKNAQAGATWLQLPRVLAAPSPRGARARRCWCCRHARLCTWRATCVCTAWPWAPLRRLVGVRRKARVSVSVCSPLSTCI